MEFLSAVQLFLNHCQYEKRLSGKTLKAYIQDFEQFGRFLKQEAYPSQVAQIDKTVLRHYIRHMQSFKPKTIKRKVASLKALFNFLEFEDQLTVNPFRKLKVRIKQPLDLPTVMTGQEVRKIFKQAYQEHKQREEGALQLTETFRDIAVLELLFATGIRVSELCRLKPVDVSFVQHFVRVRGKGDRERIVQFSHPETRRALKDYYQHSKEMIEHQGWFFVNRLGNRLSEQSVRLMVRKYVRKANIDKPITPHSFRHTFATLLLEENVDIRYIQQLLGHSSINTTQIYTHVNTRHQGKILAARHPRRHFTTDEW